MSTQKYGKYCREIYISHNVNPAPVKEVKKVGGNQTSVSEAGIQIPFRNLGIIIDPRFNPT